MGYDPENPPTGDVFAGAVRLRIRVSIPVIAETDAERVEVELNELAKQYPGTIIEINRYPALAGSVG